MKPDLILACVQPPENRARLAEVFNVTTALTAEDRLAAYQGVGKTVRAVLTNGTVGLTAEQMDMMPKLEIVGAAGVGYENVDVPAARARGITVTHGPGTNDSTVADHTMALLLSVVRGLTESQEGVRKGGWNGIRLTRPILSGRPMGILGLGTIGRQIALRAAGGFAMPIAYHNRKPRDDVPYRYCGSVLELARESDFLILTTPGGAGTKHMVNAAVLEALGPNGFLVNVARGSVVDTQALMAALRAGTIAGAALDVVEGEPDLPAGLLETPNLLITPHVAGRSPEANSAIIELAIANILARLDGKPVKTPVP